MLVNDTGEQNKKKDFVDDKTWLVLGVLKGVESNYAISFCKLVIVLEVQWCKNEQNLVFYQRAGSISQKP